VPPRDWRFWIKDILKAVEAIRQYTEGMEFSAFTKDRRPHTTLNPHMLLTTCHI